MRRFRFRIILRKGLNTTIILTSTVFSNGKRFVWRNQKQDKVILRMKFIDDKIGFELCDEAKLLGSQIGELMKKVKNRITEEKARLRKSQGVQARNT